MHKIWIENATYKIRTHCGENSQQKNNYFFFSSFASLLFFQKTNQNGKHQIINNKQAYFVNDNAILALFLSKNICVKRKQKLIVFLIFFFVPHKNKEKSDSFKKLQKINSSTCLRPFPHAFQTMFIYLFFLLNCKKNCIWVVHWI